MSSEGSEASSSSRIRQFGLYRTIDAKTDEFLRSSRKRQITQGCACAAISTAITVTVVVSVILVYEYSINIDTNDNKKLALRPKWLGLMNESDSLVMDSKNMKNINLDRSTLKLLPILLKALNENRYLEKVLEEYTSSSTPYDRAENTENYVKRNIFSDAKNWLKMPSSKILTVDYKTTPLIYIRRPAQNLDYLNRIRKMKNYERMLNYFDKMINDKVVYSRPNNAVKLDYEYTETPMKPVTKLKTINVTKKIKHKPTLYRESLKKHNVTKHKKPKVLKVIKNKITSKNVTCTCPKDIGHLLNTLIQSLQGIVPYTNKMSPCSKKSVTKPRLDKKLLPKSLVSETEYIASTKMFREPVTKRVMMLSPTRTVKISPITARRKKKTTTTIKMAKPITEETIQIFKTEPVFYESDIEISTFKAPDSIIHEMETEPVIITDVYTESPIILAKTYPTSIEIQTESIRNILYDYSDTTTVEIKTKPTTHKIETELTTEKKTSTKATTTTTITEATSTTTTTQATTKAEPKITTEPKTTEPATTVPTTIEVSTTTTPSTTTTTTPSTTTTTTPLTTITTTPSTTTTTTPSTTTKTTPSTTTTTTLATTSTTQSQLETIFSNMTVQTGSAGVQSEQMPFDLQQEPGTFDLQTAQAFDAQTEPTTINELKSIPYTEYKIYATTESPSTQPLPSKSIVEERDDITGEQSEIPLVYMAQYISKATTRPNFNYRKYTKNSAPSSSPSTTEKLSLITKLTTAESTSPSATLLEPIPMYELYDIHVKSTDTASKETTPPTLPTTQKRKTTELIVPLKFHDAEESFISNENFVDTVAQLPQFKHPIVPVFKDEEYDNYYIPPGKLKTDIDDFDTPTFPLIKHKIVEKLENSNRFKNNMRKVGYKSKLSNYHPVIKNMDTDLNNMRKMADLVYQQKKITLENTTPIPIETTTIKYVKQTVESSTFRTKINSPERNKFTGLLKRIIKPNIPATPIPGTKDDAMNFGPYQPGNADNDEDFQDEWIKQPEISEINVAYNKSDKFIDDDVSAANEQNANKKKTDDKAISIPNKSMIPPNRPTYLEIRRNNDWKSDDQTDYENMNLPNNFFDMPNN